MIDDLAKVHPTIIERCKECTADRGYDDGKLIVKLWDDYKIKPVIDIRNLWKDQGCPAKHYGINCQGFADCPVAKGIRIKLEEDRRLFIPLARSSYAWQLEYDKRTGVERVTLD
jgi:hypothetical protein